MAVSVAPDATILVASRDGVVRRVGADGRIRTVAGGGSVDSGQLAPEGGAATTVEFSAIADVAGLSDGAVAVLDQHGLFRVSSDGFVTRVAAADENAFYRVLPYQDGISVATARVSSPSAVIEDPLGGLLLGTDDGVRLIAPASGTQRLAVSIVPDTLRVARDRRAVLYATDAGSGTLTLFRGGRRVASSVMVIPAGRSVATLPGSPASRVHRLVVSLRAPDGRVAVDALDVLTGPRLAARDAARALIDTVGSDNGDVGTGFQALGCTRLSALELRCRFREYDLELRPSSRNDLGHESATVFVRDDGTPWIHSRPEYGPRPLTSRARRRASIWLFGWWRTVDAWVDDRRRSANDAQR